ncbi:ABC transporter permease [Nocardiopsis coralliicola]
MSGAVGSRATVRVGLRRGWIETRSSLTDPMEMFGSLFMIGIMLAVLFFLRGDDLEATGVSVGLAGVPGVIGMLVVMGGLVSTATSLAMDREDGTLLRAKALPGGVSAYLLGKAVYMVLLTAALLAIVFTACAVLFEGFAGAFVSGLPMVVGVLVLGMAACVPVGAALGALFESPRAVGMVGMVPIMGLTAISGVFYPVTMLPEWVQGLVQVFPVYWLGLGMRSALLPDTMLAVEIGESWRTLEMVGVLGAWGVAGYLLAPFLLRRMARRVTGSKVEEARQRAMTRVG